MAALCLCGTLLLCLCGPVRLCYGGEQFTGKGGIVLADIGNFMQGLPLVFNPGMGLKVTGHSAHPNAQVAVYALAA